METKVTNFLNFLSISSIKPIKELKLSEFKVRIPLHKHDTTYPLVTWLKRQTWSNY